MPIEMRSSSFLPGWRAVAVRGVLAILFGVLALGWPGATLAALAVAFGVYALADGLVAIGIGAAVRRSDRAWLLPLEGLVGAAVGVCALLWGGPTVLVMTVLVGVWAVVTGALEIAIAARLREAMRGEIFLAIAGATSMALGALLLLFPKMGALFLVLVLGTYAVTFGAAMLILALRLRRWERRFDDESHATAW